jgi:hypothetical protein
VELIKMTTMTITSARERMPLEVIEENTLILGDGRYPRSHETREKSLRCGA